MLVSQVPNFEIFLMSTRLDGVYTQMATTQRTSNNTGSIKDSMILLECSRLDSSNGENTKYDTWEKLHQNDTDALQTL